jgi:hypothetical protein
MEGNMRSLRLALAGLLLSSSVSVGWDGIEVETGNSVEIESGNLVRTGKDIEVYDATAGKYRSVTVESIDRSGGTVEVEVYDHDSGEYTNFEMDD